MMIRTALKLPVGTYSLLAILGSGAAAAFDMRDCPTDRVTFINTWSDEYFDVMRVGSNYYYICGDSIEITIEPKDPASCRGPYGALILAGTLKGQGEPRELDAIYHLNSSGAPCCGWQVASPSDRDDWKRPIKWLTGKEVPALGAWPLDGIDNSWGGSDDLNGMIPMVCRDIATQ